MVRPLVLSEQGRSAAPLAQILSGFGCTLIAYGLTESEQCRELGVKYVGLNELLQVSDVVSLHLPLTPETVHLMNKNTLGLMKDNAIFINTSRGAIVNTVDLIAVLKQRWLRGVGLGVYGEESEVYYRDLRDQIIDDDTFSRLLSFPNVLVTGHQGFFTKEALDMIAETTIQHLCTMRQERTLLIRLAWVNCWRFYPYWLQLRVCLFDVPVFRLSHCPPRACLKPLVRLAVAAFFLKSSGTRQFRPSPMRSFLPIVFSALRN